MAENKKDEKVDVHSAENDAIVAEFERKANEAEAAEKAAKAAAAKLFNIDDFTVNSDEVCAKTILKLGCTVRYKRLTADERLLLRGVPVKDLSLHLLYLMMNKADPNVTMKKMQNMDLLVAGVLIEEIVDSVIPAEKHFLSPAPPKQTPGLPAT